MKNSSATPMGSVMRSKYGSPTDSRRFWSASASSGYTVPTSTTSANPANSRLLTRNADSRDQGESMRPGARRRSARQAMSPIPTAAQIPRNTSSHGPMADSVNECTELMTPERVRNVPRMVRQNVAMTSERFQTRSIPRRSWTITE